MRPTFYFIRFMITLIFIITAGLFSSYSQQGIFGMVYSNCVLSSNHTALKAVDGDFNTFYANETNDGCGMHLYFEFTTTMKAAKLKITANSGGIILDVDNVSGYYTTANPIEEFYIVKPNSFSNITLYTNNTSWYNVYEIEVEPINIEAVSIPYHYDEAGNMIVRTIVIGKSAKLNEDEPFIQETLNDRNIILYPNPTRGIITLQIDIFEPDDKASVEVVNISGVKIIENNIYGHDTSIDLSNNPAGTYIMVIRINGSTSKWTVIKE